MIVMNYLMMIFAILTIKVAQRSGITEEGNTLPSGWSKEKSLGLLQRQPE